MRNILLVLCLLIAKLSIAQTVCDSLLSAAGNAYQEQGAEAAIAIYDKMISLKCDSLSVVYSRRGFMYNTIRKYDNALSGFNNALGIDSLNAYANKAATNSYLHKYSDAIKLLNTAIKLSPNSSLFYKMRADIETNNNENNIAISDYERSITLDSSDDV
ncbi:MAG TPA: hypothetical protein VGB84_10550, partial [Arachidicoccus sp.]